MKVALTTQPPAWRTRQPIKVQFFLCNLALWSAFAPVYHRLAVSDARATTDRTPHFSNLAPDFGDAAYFALTTQLTVGYGDKTPTSPLAKAVVCLHMVLSFYVNILEMLYPTHNVWNYPRAPRILAEVKSRRERA